MILSTSNQVLKVVLSGSVTANECPITASYIDGTITSYTPTPVFSVTNSTTAVSVITGPASNQIRIQEFTLYNADTASITATVYIDNNGTNRTVIKVTLAVGDLLQYTVADGWSVTDSAGNLKQSAYRTTNDRLRQLSWTVDGGGQALTTGAKSFIECPYSGRIQAVRLFADQTGSIVVDLWKDTYANYPPDVSDTITASAKPTLSSAASYQDTTLTGWITQITAGDVLRLNIDSVATITRILCSLTVLTD